MRTAAPLILISDHDPVYLQLMEELLHEEGDRVVVAESSQVYAMVRSEAAQLLIIDLPITSADQGFTSISAIRLDPRTAALPILICSANTFLIRDNSARLAALGCAVLFKPFLLDELLTSIGRLLMAASDSASALHHQND